MRRTTGAVPQRRRPKPVRKQAYHHGRLRETLVEQGAQLIERGGLASLTLRSVAETAGVSRQAPYHHFGDTDGLLVAIAIEGFEHLTEAMRAEAGRHESLEDRLVALGVIYVALARANPRQFALCSGALRQDPAAYPELMKARDGARFVLEGAVAEYLAAHDSRRDRTAATAAAWAMAHGLAHLFVEGALFASASSEAEHELVQQAFRVVTRGLVAPNRRR